MSSETKAATPEQVAHIQKLSDLRLAIAIVIDAADELLAKRPTFGAELTLSKRALQTSRHWLGECLAFLPTGYRVTDNPNDPGSESVASNPQETSA